MQPYETNVHELTTGELCEKFNTNPDTGLTSRAVQQARTKYGFNALTPSPQLPWFAKLLICLFSSYVQQLLWLGSIVCVILYGSTSNILALIGFIVLIILALGKGLVEYWQESKLEDINEGFKRISASVMALRNGEETMVEAEELVPGDIIYLKNGTIIPADIRFLECRDVEVDQTGLSGEAEPRKRIAEPESGVVIMPMDARNLAFSGSRMVKGEAKALVFKIGDETFSGRMMKFSTSVGNQI